MVLHTGGGGQGSMWREAGYVTGLDQFKCILLDHRGHGLSGKPAGVEPHRMQHYVADVVSILDALAIAKTAFWGYSSGADVGYALAATHPERVRALVASGAIGPRDYNGPEERSDAERIANLCRQHGVPSLIKEYEEAEGTSFPPWFWRQMTDTDGEMFSLEILGAAEWQGPWTVLPSIAAPVLMLVGELEDPQENSPRAAARLRDGRCVTFAGLGHVGAYLRSDLALAHAVPFLEAVTSRPV